MVHTANLRTNIMDFGGFDSSIIAILVTQLQVSVAHYALRGKCICICRERVFANIIVM